MRDQYYAQVDLLLDVLPHVMMDSRIAIKGGTAINLFYRDLPRLSVDIDICYLPIEDRIISFKNIHEILEKIKVKLEGLGFRVKTSKPLDAKSEAKLFVGNEKTEIKIEPNFTLRGSVYAPEVKMTSDFVSQKFGKEVEALCLNHADIFGGKICAALDRQHPRDLFDIKYLFEEGGFSDDVRKSFIVHLISHPRPIHEVLNPNLKEISKSFENEFRGMTTIEVKLAELIQTRLDLIQFVKENLTVKEKEFLVTFNNTAPNWTLLELKDVDHYPAVKWKLLNLQKMDHKKRTIHCEHLKDWLS